MKLRDVNNAKFKEINQSIHEITERQEGNSQRINLLSGNIQVLNSTVKNENDTIHEILGKSIHLGKYLQRYGKESNIGI